MLTLARYEAIANDLGDILRSQPVVHDATVLKRLEATVGCLCLHTKAPPTNGNMVRKARGACLDRMPP
eukprot:492709-Amphidinium_carterae.1